MDDLYSLRQQRRTQSHDTSGELWYYAVDYLDEAKAKIAWERIHGVTVQHRIRVSQRRLTYNDLLSIVVLHAPTPPPEAHQQRLRQALADGIPIPLSPTVLAQLTERNREATIEALREGTPELMHRHKEGIRREADMPQEAIDLHLAALRERYPFFQEYYRHVLPYNLHFRLKAANGAAYLHAYEQQMVLAEMYRFTATARAMHQAVYEAEESWIAWEQDIWIEQDEPLEIVPGHPVQVLFVNKVEKPHQVYNPYGHPWWNITAIGPNGLHQMVMLYDDQEQTYDPTIDYLCPTNDCQDHQIELDGGIALARSACPACLEHAKLLAMWLHTALRMLRRDFATSAAPEPFTTGEHITTQKKLVPRQHGKGKPKERTIEHRRPYTIVAYEVSIAESRPASVPTGEEDKRQSWLSLHGQEHRIYELRAVPTHERHYRGPYWDRLIARCLEQVQNGESGRVELDGVVYQVDISQGGEVTVKRTIEVPNGRYVPLLRPEYKKQPTVKKTTAKRFGQVTEE